MVGWQRFSLRGQECHVYHLSKRTSTQYFTVVSVGRFSAAISVTVNDALQKDMQLENIKNTNSVKT